MVELLRNLVGKIYDNGLGWIFFMVIYNILKYGGNFCL